MSTICAQGVWLRKKLWHSLFHSISLAKQRNVKKLLCLFFHSISLSIYVYIYVYIYTRMRTHKIWQCGLRLIAWRKLWFLHRVTLLSAAQPAGLTYTQTNTQELVLHPTPNSTRFKSRRGNLNTEFHVFLRNVCPIHFGMCIHKLPLLFAATKPCK